MVSSKKDLDHNKKTVRAESSNRFFEFNKFVYLLIKYII